MKIKLLFALIMLSIMATAQSKSNQYFDESGFRVTRDLTGIGFIGKKLMIFTVHKDIYEKALKELKNKIIRWEINRMPKTNLQLKEYTIYFKIKDSLAVRKWGNENL